MRTDKPNADLTISGVHIVTPKGVTKNAKIDVSKGRIADIYSSQATSLTDAIPTSDRSEWVIPGLIDTHVHGAGGHDTMDGKAAALKNMSETLLRVGTTAFLATTMTATDQVLAKALQAVSDYVLAGHAFTESECLGVHLEGPFIHSDYLGAQKRELVQSANPEKVQDYVKWSGNTLRIATLAPELPDAEKVMRVCQAHGIRVSAGHTSATWKQSQQAKALGVTHITHGFNAMRSLHHREPGLIGWALADSSIWLEMIADGIHIHPSILSLVYRLKGAEKMILISDGTRAVGMEDGEYELGDQHVWVKDGCVRLDNGTLAGSRISLLDAVRNMIFQASVPVHEAVNMASIVPARFLGVDKRIGSLEVGKEATFLKLDASWGLKEVWVQGKMAWQAS